MIIDKKLEADLIKHKAYLTSLPPEELKEILKDTLRKLITDIKEGKLNMQSQCPECKSNKTKHYPLNTDSNGNPTDGSYLSYCTECDWEEEEV